MLLFSSETFTVDGITVFPDHSDPNQFWYLPGPVGLAKLPGSDEPQFLLTMFTPDVAANGVTGAGFLNVTLGLVPSAETQSKIMGKIRTQFDTATDPRIAPVPFDEGTVQIVTLDLQGSGGTSATAAPPGTFQAVQSILGASTPELFGDNNALFGLKLTPAGATILEKAFEDGMAPVGGIYNLKFTGVLPSLDVKITADLKRAYQSFSIGLEAKVYWVSAGIDATFEKLRQDGVIKVEIVNLSTSASVADKEQWALNLFKDQLLSQWFTPSLSPTTAQQASVPIPTLGSSGGSSTSLPHPPQTTGTGTTATTAGGMRPPTPTTSATGGSSGMRPTTATGTSATGTTAPGTAAAAGATAAAVASTAGMTAPGAAATGAAVGTMAGAATGAAPAPAAPAAPTQPATPVNLTPTAAPATANPISQAAGTAAAASSAASPFGVALQLKYVQQDELKTVSIEYNRMDAVQRTYAPQGYFGLALQGLDKSKHFLKVDGTDPFFNKFTVTLNPPKDFAGIGLLAAHVAVDYGDQNSSDPPKHGEFEFDAGTAPAPQTWSIFEGLVQETSYTYTVDYKFDPESGWEGEQTSYQLPPVQTDNRTINLDPYDFLGFMAISVAPQRMDPNVVDRIELALQYEAKSGWQTSTTFVVKPDSKPQVWKLRLTGKHDPDPTYRYSEYSYSTTCYLKDGTTFSSGPIRTSANSILVSDPFPSGLDLLFQPAYDPTTTKLAIVEVMYRDDANHYSYLNSFEIAGATTTPVKIRIPRVDPNQNQYQYRVTVLGTNNQRVQGNYLSASDPLVLVTV